MISLLQSRLVSIDKLSRMIPSLFLKIVRAQISPGITFSLKDAVKKISSYLKWSWVDSRECVLFLVLCGQLKMVPGLKHSGFIITLMSAAMKLIIWPDNYISMPQWAFTKEMIFPQSSIRAHNIIHIFLSLVIEC